MILRLAAGMMTRVGVLFDYFAASSDEVAAGIIDLPGGPATGAGRSFDTVSGNGIDPVVQMGTLEALLTGRDGPHPCRPGCDAGSAVHQ
jgi:hypothetical protein